MKRFATLTKLKPGAKEQYKKIHDEIWDEIIAANDESNFHNFSIYIIDDYMFSYFEYTGSDYDADIKKKLSLPAIAKWRDFTGQYTDFVKDGIKTIPLEELWHNDFIKK